MHWLRFRHAGQTGLGCLVGDAVEVYQGDLFAEHQPTGQTLPLTDIEWLTPCQPTQMVAIWNNFHALAEKNSYATPEEPLWLLKSPSSFNPHTGRIPKPAVYDGRIVYEGELGIVIGKTTRNVSEADAPAHIFGYTCVNDVTALEILQRDPSFAQWARAKSFDGFGCFGPVISTESPLASAEVVVTVGGRERQRYPLADMICPPARLVALISRDLTLQPGDVIACGTSVGVLPIKPGSEVTVTIEGIGTLANTLAAD